MTAAPDAMIEAWIDRTTAPAMARANYARFVLSPSAAEWREALAADDHRGLRDLLTVFATSQFLADVLIDDPTTVAFVLNGSNRNLSTSDLTDELADAVDAAPDDAAVLRALWRFRRRQTLRVGLNDILRDRALEEITRDLCRVADAVLEVATRQALKNTSKKHGVPMTPSGVPAKLTGLAFGKLGGDELNYSSDLDLMFLHDEDGETAGKRGGMANAEFFARTVSEILRLVGSHTDAGIAYRIDLRLRPEGRTGPLSRTLAGTLSYYDVMGRTWERQALIKCRHVCGDPGLGREFLAAIEPYIYRKYFSFSEINEVKALKRQMEARATRHADDGRDLKTGRGGIRDIEFTVQFLQLLNGGDLPAVHQRNTLLALEALEIAGCLSGNENYLLADAYRFLRKVEHRVQLVHDLQTHALPAADADLETLALRIGFGDDVPERRGMSSLLDDALARLPVPRLDAETEDATLTARERFLKALKATQDRNRTILDHLLHETFAGDAQAAEPESDLILDPHPDAAAIQGVLSKHRFKDPERAYANLLSLARESVRFLSHRRCRHFLASIAPQLLKAVSDTPDPDAALENLDRVTASLGAKAVLYEVFSFNPPSLKLYVDLCAGSSFLSALLINNPGMIDELLDTLVLDQPRTRDELAAELALLLKGATDLDPILHSFQDKELLRIGVRDLFGKSLIQETYAALSDLAEVIVLAVYGLHEKALTAKRGPPPAAYALVGLGKLGGRELSYHSDVDLLLLYDGADESAAPGHYFTELAQHSTRTLTNSGPMGKLYSVDMRLRPFGKSGSLAVPLAEFRRYFTCEGASQLWERQALCRARVLGPATDFSAVVKAELAAALTAVPWSAADTPQLRSMRDKLQQTCSPRNLKRGPGGIVDIEFVIQLFQLRHGARHPGILKPNVWDVFFPLRGTNLVTPTEATALAEHYTFLRTLEAKLRMMTDRGTNDVPDAGPAATALAQRLGFADHAARTAAEHFLAELQRVTSDVRGHFDAITRRES